MKKILIICFITFFVTSCKTVEVVKEVPIEIPKIVNTSDTLIFHQKDSIFIHMKKDTVFVEKFKTIFKEKIKNQSDTIFKTITLEKTKKIPQIKKGFFYYMGIFASIIILLIFAYCLIKRTLTYLMD